MYKEDDYLMLSGLQHFVFCRRQWALIHIEQQWSENYQTTAGELMHKNAHDEDKFEKRGDTMIARGLRIASPKLGLSGQCDVVEFHKAMEGVSVFGYEGCWKIVPIEYKRGKAKEGKEDEVQLCAQAMCLEEMFLTQIDEGFLYYGETKRRTCVLFSEELRNYVSQCAMEMHNYFDRGYTPKVKSSGKCRSCSLFDLCVPKLNKKGSVNKYIEVHLIDEDADKEDGTRENY
ncbi:MAG: CRISPR-associated protein Cas4 [Clostridiales bacterium]|nr:CRISPR-associated protein Cas4 [Clostridiales bacterium]